MLQTMKIAAIAAFAVLVALTPARAADVATADDTARFLAGMQPSADSPLAPLTKNPSWRRHARFFDETFGRFEQNYISNFLSLADTILSSPLPTIFSIFIFTVFL